MQIQDQTGFPLRKTALFVLGVPVRQAVAAGPGTTVRLWNGGQTATRNVLEDAMDPLMKNAQPASTSNMKTNAFHNVQQIHMSLRRGDV